MQCVTLRNAPLLRHLQFILYITHQRFLFTVSWKYIAGSVLEDGVLLQFRQSDAPRRNMNGGGGFESDQTGVVSLA